MTVPNEWLRTRQERMEFSHFISMLISAMRLRLVFLGSEEQRRNSEINSDVRKRVMDDGGGDWSAKAMKVQKVSMKGDGWAQ